MDLRIITFILSSSFFLACSEAPTRVQEPAPQTASVRALHLSKDVPAVDLFVDYAGAPAFRDLTFGNASPYLDISVGRSIVDVVDGGQRLRTIELNLEKDRLYTSVILDDRVVTFDDAAGSMRLINAARNAGSVDVWDLERNEAIARDLQFGNAASGVAPGRRLGIDMNQDAAPDMIFVVPESDVGVIDMVIVDDEETVNITSYFSDGTSEEAEPEPQAPTSIRVLHLSPDAPNVDVLTGGARVVENLAFTRSTPFLEVPAADYVFDVTATGDETPVLSVDLTLAADQRYTAVAFGPVSDLQALALVEAPTPPDTGIQIRVAHVANGVGQVDVINLTTEEILLDDVDFGTATELFAAPAGAHSLGLDLDDDGVSEVAFDLPELADGATANIFAVADDAGAFLLVQLIDGTTLRINPRHAPEPEPEPEISFVRALHLAPDAPPVNAFVNGAAAVETLLFKQGTGPLEVESGETTIDVSAGAIEESILTATLNLAPDTNYTVAVFDSVTAVQALPLVDDLSSPAAGNIRIRAVHTAVGVGPVNIFAGSALLYEDVPFGAAGAALEVPAGAYTIGLDVDDDHHPDLFFDVPELTEGTIANVFAVTDTHGTPSLIAQLAGEVVVEVPLN